MSRPRAFPTTGLLLLFALLQPATASAQIGSADLARTVARSGGLRAAYRLGPLAGSIPGAAPRAATTTGLSLLAEAAGQEKIAPGPLVAGGIVGMAGGLVLAAGIGSFFTSECEGWFCFPPSFVAGLLSSFVTVPLGVATGVHMANGRRGDFNRVFGSALGSNVVGFIGAAVVSSALRSPVGLLLWPGYQLYRVVRMEIDTSRPGTPSQDTPFWKGIR